LKKIKQVYKFILGALFALIFLLLAFRQVDFGQLMHTLKSIKSGYVCLAFLVLFINTVFRAMRWKLLLSPIGVSSTGVLLSTLLIGHAGNIIFPAHIGEIIRVYILRNRTTIPASAALATIVTERLIDIVFLLAILFLSVFQFDFPDWVKKSGYLMLVLTAIAAVFIILLKTKTENAFGLLRKLSSFLPEKFQKRILLLASSFISGFVPLKQTADYLAVFVLSLLIWTTHLLSFVFGLIAFSFHLPWIASFVLIVITTISVAFPITPGFVGSYHLLCQFSLSLFGIAKGPALGFALVIHGINTLPFLLIGLALAWREGVNFFLVSKRDSLKDNYSEINKRVLQ